MQSILVKNRGARFLIAAALLITVVALFWTSSRYPSLDDKALMGGAIHLEDPLSFEAVIPVEPDFPIWKKVVFTTINWIDTNRQGMTFGIIMGALLLTLLRYIRRVSFKNSFLNAGLGLLIGAPLGVCVNCAAPIAKGMYAGGARAETMLAAMIASPTLNIVVLTMMISLLPGYIVVTKIALSCAIILVAIPLICRILPRKQLTVFDNEGDSCPIPKPVALQSAESFFEAILGLGRDLLKDFWYIIKLTLPLMILAGFLGAIVATLLPIELFQGLKFGLISLICIAVIGTFLPVPIAFDVVICAALLAAGLDIGYVMALLFTLGIFSVYSAFITTQTISLYATALLSLVIVVTGIFAGLGVSSWHNHKTKQALEMLTSSASSSAPAGPSEELKSEEPITTTEINPIRQAANDFDVSISAVPFNPKSPAGDTLFVRREAHEIGIDQGVEFELKDMWPPFWEGRSIASADIDKDGDLDILIASTEYGFHLYLNDGSGRFSRGHKAPDSVKDWPIFNAALVDMNNDSWPDMVIATYKKGNHILWNQDGRFDQRPSTPIKNNPEANLSLALSFGDVDKDGDLDIALGNWSAGWYRRIPGDESRNRVVFNENGKITGDRFLDLTGLPGETLSILLTDMNLDGSLDLLVGNDFEPPDIYYYGDGVGGFSRILNSQDLIPHTTNTTMAIKHQDLDNDLIPDIYLAQIAGRASGLSERLKMRPIEEYCDTLTRPTDKARCEKNMEIKTWYRSGNNFNPSYADKCLELDPNYQAQCKAMLVKDLAIQAKDKSICDLISPTQAQASDYCAAHFLPDKPHKAEQLEDNYTQVFGRNVLLKRSDSGPYIDAATTSGLEVGGWSWDTKIADFDNDGWQDVYIVNGTWVPNEFTPSNLYFSNIGDGKFEEKAAAFGLDDFLITAAASHVDIDNDGDLDILTIPVNGPVQSFMNTSQTGNAVIFALDDQLGNHDGIGARITISFDDENSQSTGQKMREIQMGGGFQSFDPPVAHFGLGDISEITSVKIDWPDGTSSVLQDRFSAGNSYTIKRE